MALIKKELEITKLKDLLDINLALPSYQRPYRWSVKSCNTLFVDTYKAFKDGVSECRLGSVILHKEESGKYNIVDGQQRLTTLSILLYCLGDDSKGLLQEKYSVLSKNYIATNYGVLKKRINELNDDESKRYYDYLLTHCMVVKIVTDSEQEAFQFFDSQNSRGKELAPHDLLKSYHLREMNHEDESQKIAIINKWENMKQDNLVDLFKYYLYPLTQWYKGEEGLGYSSSKIDSFKGIKRANIFNYAIYHKASNLYVEQFNANGSNELITSEFLNQFQLTQPVIAGKRFFSYTLTYSILLEKSKDKIKRFAGFHALDNQVDKLIPNERSGDKYILQLYECSLLFFTDRFGFDSLTDSVMQQLYTWSYSLRLTMKAVYPQSINKYAKGQHERVNVGIAMFRLVSEMKDPEELKLLVFEKPDFVVDDEKYKAIRELLCKWNGWK